MKFNEGDKVTITIPDCVVVSDGPDFDGEVSVRDPEGNHDYYAVKYVTVTERAKKTPEFWPPREGDVWRWVNATHEYLYTYVCGTLTCVQFPDKSWSNNSAWRETLDDFLANRPDVELVYRRTKALTDDTDAV